MTAPGGFGPFPWTTCIRVVETLGSQLSPQVAAPHMDPAHLLGVPILGSPTGTPQASPSPYFLPVALYHDPTFPSPEHLSDIWAIIRGDRLFALKMHCLGSS